MVIHPLDPTIRYARTDVGNAYRWDVPTQQWIPMRVSSPDGTGVQNAAETFGAVLIRREQCQVDSQQQAALCTWCSPPSTVATRNAPQTRRRSTRASMAG